MWLCWKQAHVSVANHFHFVTKKPVHTLHPKEEQTVEDFPVSVALLELFYLFCPDKRASLISFTLMFEDRFLLILTPSSPCFKYVHFTIETQQKNNR